MLVLSVVAVLATAVQAADPVVSVTASDAPDPVSAGLVATYTFALANDSNPTLTNTEFTAALPTGSSLDSGSFSTTAGASGSCAESAGTVTCDVGSLNGQADATVVLQIVAPTTAFEVCGSFAYKEGANESDPSHLDTVTACSSSDVRPADDPNFRGGCIDGGTLSTGSTATSTDRQNTAVTVAGEACVIVAETVASGPSEACGAGFNCITEISDVVLPSCSVTDPCTVTLTFDKSFGKVRRIFKDGVLVAPCANPGAASPDPCVVSRSQLKGGDTRFVLNFAVDARLRGG